MGGRIYVDLDDVLSRTIDALVALLELHHGRSVAVEDVVDFDLGRSFGLDPPQLADFMRRVHEPAVLGGLEPSPGAAPALAAWIERGYAVAIVTGRPLSTEPVSRRWLRERAIPHTSFACVDKYARPDWHGGSERAPTLDTLSGAGFDLAVEDSLAVAVRLALECDVPVALLDRPWNRDLSRIDPAAAARIARCRSWAEIAERFPTP